MWPKLILIMRLVWALEHYCGPQQQDYLVLLNAALKVFGTLLEKLFPNINTLSSPTVLCL